MRWTTSTAVPRCLLFACALAVAGACSSKEAPPATDAGAGGNQDAPAGVGTEVSLETGAMTGAPRLCAEIRNCIVRCDNAACAQSCVDQAPAAARTKYQEVTACSKQACAEDDVPCRCDRECFEGGACLNVVDECREGVEDDTFCDELCH